MILNSLNKKIYITDELSGDTANVNTDGKLEMVLGGIIDENNSTNTPLLSGETFTGTATEILDFSTIIVNVFSDIDSATNGLSIEFSVDGNNWDNTDKYTIPANNGKFYTLPPAGKYFRVLYTNGSSDQTEFRLQSILKYMNFKPSSHRLEDSVIYSDDAELTKSIIAYEDVNDKIFKNVSVQNPFPVDGDFVFAKDVWETESDMGNFGSNVKDLFNNLHTIIKDETTNSPKELFIHFNKTIISNVVGFGAYGGGTFSNVKISIFNSGNIETLVYDDSSNNTKFTTLTCQLPITAGFNAVKLYFYTSDTVTLSNIVIPKTKGVVSRLQAVDYELNTVQNIGAHRDVDGEYYLSSAIIQAIHTDPYNSSTTPLSSGNSYMFVGDAVSTIGAAAIQWSLSTDKNAIVYVDQSPDGINWNISDEFKYFYSKGGDGVGGAIMPIIREKDIPDIEIKEIKEKESDFEITILNLIENEK